MRRLRRTTLYEVKDDLKQPQKIPLENSSISDSEPLQRAQSGFSRDAAHSTRPAVTHEALLALSPQFVGERCGELIDAATIPAQAGLDSLMLFNK